MAPNHVEVLTSTGRPRLMQLQELQEESDRILDSLILVRDGMKSDNPAGTRTRLEAKLAAHDDRIERKIADMVQTLDVARGAGLTA